MRLSSPQEDRCGRVVRRTYDQLELERFTAHRGGSQFADRLDSAGWPFVALYAVGESGLVFGSGRSILLNRGECCILRNRPDLTISGEGAFDLLVVNIPAELVGLYRRTFEQADGRKCLTYQGTGSLVSHFLEGLAREFETYVPRNPGRLAQHIVGMLALMCSDAMTSDEGWSRSKLLERSKEFIELHLCDLRLTPERIAAAQNMSSRNLHRLFEREHLTVAGWIRQRRLEHCRVDLSDSAFSDLPVSHIGARWGLWDAAHFSRLFKAAYDLSPGAYRLARRSSRTPTNSVPSLRQRRDQSA